MVRADPNLRKEHLVTRAIKVWLPNALSIYRIVAVPFIVVSGMSNEWIQYTTLVAIGAASDILDGYLARKWDVVSTFGKHADTVADKIFIPSCLIVFLHTGDVYPSVFWVILGREILVILLKNMTRGGIAWHGQVKMWLQCAFVIYLPLTKAGVLSPDFIPFANIIVAFWTIGSGLAYFANRKPPS